MGLSPFHPIIQRWFASRFTAPTEPQGRAWPLIRKNKNVLVAAPTGSGKTFAAFLSAIDSLLRQALTGKLEDETQVIYVSPLKALSNDIQKNLTEPLAEISQAAGVSLRTWLRTGDTPSAERQAMLKRPPHIIVTTPESLFLLLTAERSRDMLKTVRTVIVDEIHAVARDKRGSHLALSLERLAALTGKPLQRIGLSATQKPIEEIAGFLVGTGGQADPSLRSGQARRSGGQADRRLGGQADKPAPSGARGRSGGKVAPCEIVDAGHYRTLDLALEIGSSPMEAVMPAEAWVEVHERLAQLISEHRTTLVFVNTRRLAERLTMHLSEKLGPDAVTAHHGSLSKERRLDAEQRLKDGKLKALVATASLELGIDIGTVDLVCQIGSTRSIATWLQRVGRSGHHLSAVPKGRIFPLSRDELIECAALLRATREGHLDRLIIPERPLDILAQQIVAEAACRDCGEDELFELVRRAYPYRALPREDFDGVVRMLADGFTTRRGRRSAHLHYDGVNHRMRGRRGARLAALTSGGAIPDVADYRVVLEPAETFVGTVNEDFAIESMPGEIFQLGNASWQITKIEPGVVRVSDAKGMLPTIPFWIGEAPSRTAELSSEVSRLRADIDARLDDQNAAVEWLATELDVPRPSGRQIVEYLAATKRILTVIPTQETIVLERFFDEAGGMQLVLHAPFGSRINRAWGLSLRKRFCRSFNFELQAAATEDAIVLSLGPQHSFALEDVFKYLHPNTVRELLIQALLDAPMFQSRWRWNATRALAILRFRNGRKNPMPLQRMEADDLAAAVFPDQAACPENLVGDREIPDHPLVRQTIDDCLIEAMDLPGLTRILEAMLAGKYTLVARDTPEPSPLSHEVLNARPYAFLDDAPLEERRTQAVVTRRSLDVKTADDLGTLDLGAIERVRDEVRPDPGDADELHDALLVAGTLPRGMGNGDTGTVEQLFDTLIAQGRAAVVTPDAADPSDPLPLAPPPAAADLSGADVPGEARDRLKRTAIPRACGRPKRTAIPRACGPRDDGSRSLWVAAERVPLITAAFPGATIEPRVNVPERERAQTWTREDAIRELVRGQLEIAGPVTAAALSGTLGLPQGDVDIGLAGLEREGFVLRGRFTPHPLSPSPSGRGGTLETLEWCERRLLSRIHRYTLDRLRKEIEPVSAADFMRFLFRWQRVAADTRAAGPDGLSAVLEILDGYELPAAAWESDVLPARVEDYDPLWLDALCLSGGTGWVRLSAPANGNGNGHKAGPIRSTPIALFKREHAAAWMGLQTGPAVPRALSSTANAVHSALGTRGASFFAELVTATGMLRTEVENGLSELAAWGLASSDSFAGLRALLIPSDRRRPLAGARRRRGSVAPFGVETAGRWALTDGRTGGRADGQDEAAVETLARQLLRRYGVVFRALLARESLTAPWRDILRVYRRLEARGEIRGGRFVNGFSGEQYALPEAIGTLRSVRREAPSGELVAVSGADPLNLVGVLTPGALVPATLSNRILFRDGAPVAVSAGAGSREPVQLLNGATPEEEREFKTALVRRRPAPLVRRYLGKSRSAV